MKGLGVLDSYLKDPEVTEIMVNDLRNIAIEKKGQLSITTDKCKDLNELNQWVDKLLGGTDHSLTKETPYAMSTLADGSRVHVIGAPVTPNGPCITIRRFPKRFSLEDLVRSKMMDTQVFDYLRDATLKKKSILIGGGTGSGKTTLLNALIQNFPATDRIVAIEDTAELVLSQANHVKLMTSTGKEPVTMRQLVRESLRMRPDRIIIGECRGPEAFDLLNAMSTGHPGSMTTVHAAHAREALHRLENLVLLNGIELPNSTVRRQIGSAIQIVVQIGRLPNGQRYISEVHEITGVETQTYILHNVFRKVGEDYEYTPSAIGVEV